VVYFTKIKTISAWLVLFGASYGIKKGSHLGVDVLMRILPTGLRRFTSIASVLCALLYCCMFGYGAWIYLRKMYKIGIKLEDIPVTKWAAHSILLLGMVLLFIRLCILLWNILKGKAEGFHLADEAKESMHLIQQAKSAAADEEVKP